MSSAAAAKAKGPQNWAGADIGSKLGLGKARRTRNVLIVGNRQAGRDLAAYFEQHPLAGCTVRGFLDDDRLSESDVLGKVDDLVRIARAEFVDEIILTAPCDRETAWKVVQEARRNRLSVKAIPDLAGLDPRSVALERIGDLPVLKLHEEHAPRSRLFVKRVADIVLAASGLAATAPLLAAIALAIKLDSSGPVFYASRRVGKKGQPFLCQKFRTMVTTADEEKERLRNRNERVGPFFKIAADPRVTRVGRRLRRYSLDELPQLWNVLRGDMSLVGPRPHPLDDFNLYRLEDLRRLDVTPGITGLWQVTARTDPSFERNLELDMQYIEQWSLGLDLWILCRTLVEVVRGSGT